MNKVINLLPILIVLLVNFFTEWFFGPYLVTRGLRPKDIYLIANFGTLVLLIGFLLGWFVKRNEAKSKRKGND